MDRMTSLRVFREVVEAGSFTAAAGRLSMSPPMASKHVAQLEKSLGARLLHPLQPPPEPDRSRHRLVRAEPPRARPARCRRGRDRPDERGAARPAQGERAGVVCHAAFRARAGRLPRALPRSAGRHAPGEPQGRPCSRRLRPRAARHAGALARADRAAAVPRALSPGGHARLLEAHGRLPRIARRPGAARRDRAELREPGQPRAQGAGRADAAAAAHAR
jgi:DNA-binding transcriptional LysR family regulator